MVKSRQRYSELEWNGILNQTDIDPDASRNLKED